MRPALALLLFGIGGLLAQPLPPEVLALARIRAGVKQAVERLPDCTCVQTVDRFWKPAGKELKPFDRAVLQILFSGGKELFAAPGDARWETNPLTFMASGMMSNGLFALHLKAVFLDNVSVIVYKGEEFVGGRREARYDFSISRLSSGYEIHRAGASGVVATRGSFWADPRSYDLYRLEFHAEEIPPELLYNGISTAIDYNRVRIGDSDVLLPRDADLRTADVNGEEKLNHIEFTHCQEFHAQSTVSFGADDSAPAAAPSQPLAEGTLAPGLGVTVALCAPLDDRAAVGSLIEGKVVGNVMQKGKVLVPDGAPVKGRLRRLERFSGGSDPSLGDYFAVALEYLEIEAPSARLRFYAELQDVGPAVGVRMFLGVRRTSTQTLPGVGTFYVQGTKFSLPAGFKTLWTTALYPRSARP
jgi:hypothetical protein